ncbi:MAG: calcium/sodium antiporter [Methanobacteriaceae archaeon]|nr:calcium/sodium antiporter [Methanobacteriaceae archaeon]
MLWIIQILILIISLIIVIKSADLFIDNLVDIGTHLGISEIILGVTAAAIGTSLPEFGSAVIASVSGNTDIGVGVVIGSNIWNIAGILGISATVAGVIRTDARGVTRDGLITLGTGLILIFFMLFGDITSTAAIVMIIVYIFYLWMLIRAQKKYSEAESSNEMNSNNKKSKEKEILDKDSQSNKKSINIKNIMFMILGFIGLVIGCKLLVDSGTELARIAGIPAMIMGLFTLAIGTSIPELVVTLSSAVKGLHNLSLGTVLGSNTFNILIGIGIPALIMNVPVDRLSLTFDAPVMIFVTALLILLSRRGDKLSRIDGLILLSIYIIYAITRLVLSGF